jgi:ADP-ribose pyrophosphatase
MNDTDKLHWKVLHSEYLAHEPWFTVRRETVELPNGNRINDYYVMEYPEWVNVIALTRDGRFVFVRQYRHGIVSVNYELCGGVCDPDDASPLYAAQRELLEETGYGNGSWEEFCVLSPNPSTQNNLTHSFLARNVEKLHAPALEDTEDLSVHLFSLDDVKRLLMQNEIRQALMAATLWKYIALYGNN